MWICWMRRTERRSGETSMTAISQNSSQCRTSISREVSRKLRLRMTGEAENRLVKRHTENIEAYQLYVRARRWCERKRGRIPAWSRISDAGHSDRSPLCSSVCRTGAVHIRPCYYGAVDPNVAYPKARVAALRSLEIDPDLAEGHAVLAHILQTYDWNWTAAEKEYNVAIELNPNYSTAHYHYSISSRNWGALTKRFMKRLKP